MYSDVLIATDASSGMKLVTEHAIEIASMSGARLHALHVVDETAYASIPDDARDKVREALEEDGVAGIDSIVDRLADNGCELVTAIRRGDPAATIITYAVENDVDLIVMGTRGRTGFERYVLGSVAEKVIRASPIPVLTVYIGDREALLEEINGVIAAER